MARLHRGKHNILQYRHVREEIEPLEYHADFLADIVDTLGIIHTDAIDDDFSCRRLFQIIDAAENRALAGSGRPDDDDNFLILDCQIDSFQDFMGPKAFFQAFNFYHL